MDIADSNKDGELTLEEMLKNSHALADSGFIKAQTRLHDDLWKCIYIVAVSESI